jgi:hypothetical protein
MSDDHQRLRRTPEQQASVREIMKHVPPAYDRATVEFGIAIGTGILCIECKACGRRSMLTKENCPHIGPGNHADVRSVTFRCARQGCGSTDVRRYGGCEPEEAKMWLAGDPMDPDREIPTHTKWEREGW